MRVSVRYRKATLAGLVAMVLSGGVASAGDQAGTSKAIVEQVTFETRSDGVTVLVKTVHPTPQFALSVGREDAPAITIAFPGSAGVTPREFASPSPFLAPVTLASGDSSSPGVVLTIRPRQARLAGIEQREDGLAIRVVAVDVADPPEESEYHVGVGDKIEIGVFGHEDMTRTVDVKNDGTISFPLLGDVKVGGKTVAEIDQDLTQRLGKEYLVDPEVSVDVREYKSQWVTLMGEVRSPGRYMLRRNMRIIDLLAEAGGPTKDAGAEIVLMRHANGGSVTRQQVYALDDIFNPAKPETNVALRHGDVVTVNQREAFYIRGEVTRPGPYYVERGMTILKAISVAGGLTQFANRKEVQLLRSSAGGIQEKTIINLKQIEDGKQGDIPILPNDVIIVPRRIF